MQNYQLDLTGYHCPIPLLIFKRVLKTYPKPYRLSLIINAESETDICLLCQEERISYLRKESEKQQIKIFLEIK